MITLCLWRVNGRLLQRQSALESQPLSSYGKLSSGPCMWTLLQPSWEGYYLFQSYPWQYFTLPPVRKASWTLSFISSINPYPFLSVPSLTGTREQFFQASLSNNHYVAWHRGPGHLSSWGNKFFNQETSGIYFRQEDIVLDSFLSRGSFSYWHAVLPSYDHGPLVLRDTERDRENHNELREERKRRRLSEIEVLIWNHTVIHNVLAPNTLSHWFFLGDSWEGHYPPWIAERTPSQCPELVCVRVKTRLKYVLHWALSHSY